MKRIKIVGFAPVTAKTIMGLANIRTDNLNRWIKNIMIAPITVRDYMTTSLVTLAPDMDILEASQTLVRHGISGAPVVDKNEDLVGMLTERDCFKVTLSASYFEELGGKVSEFMSRDVETVVPEMSILDLAELFLKTKYRRYPVVLENRLIGLISRRDALKALLALAWNRT